MKPSGRFDRKHIVVTGSSGILGRAVVSTLLAEGAFVSGLDKVGPEYSEISSSTERFQFHGCDISSQDEVEVAVLESVREFGPIFGLHNNAATKTKDLSKFFAKTLDFDLNTWDEVMDVNLKGMLIVAKAVIPYLTKPGSIVQTASIYGATMGPDFRIYDGSLYLGRQITTPVVYTTSKAGVHGLTNHLATEFGPEGIRVNTLTPGGISSGQNEEFEDKYSARVPMRRMAQAEEVARVVAFLLSEDASYITGQNLAVDGGLSAW